MLSQRQSFVSLGTFYKNLVSRVIHDHGVLDTEYFLGTKYTELSVYSIVIQGTRGNYFAWYSLGKHDRFDLIVSEFLI